MKLVLHTGLVYISQCKGLLAPQTVPPCHARVYKLCMRRRATVVVVVIFSHALPLSKNKNSRTSTNIIPVKERGRSRKKTENFGAYFYTLFATSDDDLSRFEKAEESHSS